jgi:hypothetical protein
LRLEKPLAIPSRSRDLRGKLSGFFSTTLTKRNSLIFILIFTSIVVIDSTIARFFSYSGIELPTTSNLAIFISFSIVYSVSSIMLINSVIKNSSRYRYKLPVNLKYFHGIITITQISMIGIIVTILLQMAIFHKYSIFLLHASTILTHISALVFVSLLIFTFAGWLKSRRNYIIIMFTVSFVLISVTIIVSLVYLESQYSATRSLSKDIRPYPIHFVLIQFPSGQWTEILSSVFDALSLSSFLTIWLATISLLYQYRYKVGRFRYFIITSIPLIYYLVPLQDYFGNVFSPLILSSPIAFGMIYVLIFSATKQIGALLFSLAFWTASSMVTNDRVRSSLLTSAIGMALLFGSIEIVTLQYKIYPPYGLVTEAFMPVGAYLLFVGIFTSAINVSRDAKLRKEFYKNAVSQFNLLKTIGVTQMEKELLKEYKPVLARSDELEEPRYQPLEQSDVKEIIRDVLQELQARESNISKNGTKKD